LNAYAQARFLSWNMDITGISATFYISGEDMHYGAGLRDSIRDNRKFFEECRKIELDIDSANIGVSYHFLFPACNWNNPVSN
jgi:hypothetical protein